MSELDFHEIASIFPLIEGEDFDQLIADIREHGVREPVWMFEGKILDGRNRYRAAQIAGAEIQQRQYTGTALDAIEFVWSLNSTRRHLSSSQRAIADAKRNKMTDAYAVIRQAARDRQVAALKQNQQEDPVKELIPERKEPAQTRDIRAKVAGTNAKYIDIADKLVEERPDLVADIEAGKKTITQVQREIRKEEHVTRLADVAAREIDAPTGIYDVVVIDPPWPMEKIERDVRPNQVAFEYPTMTEDELRQLAIPAAEDCHVWLWTTHKFMPMALRLLDAWDMKYVCTFVWHKPGGFQPIGLPQFNCEFAIYARVGVPSFIDTKAFNTCFTAPRGKHSEKPEEFYELLRRVTGGRRLDMFNRRAIDGFASWGKEAAA